MHERRENIFVFALGLFVSGIKLFALFWVFSSCVIFGFLSPPQIPFRTMSTCYYFSSFLGKGRGGKEEGCLILFIFRTTSKTTTQEGNPHTYTYRNYPLATTDVKEQPAGRGILATRAPRGFPVSCGAGQATFVEADSHFGQSYFAST